LVRSFCSSRTHGGSDHGQIGHHGGDGHEPHGCRRHVGRQRLRTVLEPAGDVHRSGGVRHDIRGGRTGQRHTGVGVHQAPEHAQRAQHVHTEPGTGRPAGHHHVRAVHVHRVHGRVVAVWRAHMQAQ